MPATLLIAMPVRLATPYQGKMLAGCSINSQSTTFSPAFHGSDVAKVAIASVTFLVKAISSASAPTSRANSPRVFSTAPNIASLSIVPAPLWSR